LKIFCIIFFIIIFLFPACKTKEDKQNVVYPESPFRNEELNRSYHSSWVFQPGEYYLLSDTFIYQHPNSDSQKIGNINIHEKIIVIQDVHNQQRIDSTTSCWYEIKYNNIEGYIFGGNIAKETFICDIDGNGINDYFQYRISRAAANYHFDSRKDIIIYINNEKIIIGDRLSTEENEHGNRGYFYNFCSFEKINNEVIITLTGAGPISEEDYIFSINGSGSISFIAHTKKGRFFENGEWIEYE